MLKARKRDDGDRVTEKKEKQRHRDTNTELKREERNLFTYLQCRLRNLNLGLNRREINHIHTCPIRQALPEIAFGVTRSAIYLIHSV